MGLRIRALGFAALTAIATSPLPAMAQQDTREVPVTFSRGTSQATYRYDIRGYQTIVYRVRAERGQQMNVRLSSGNRSLYMNVLPPRGNEAIHRGDVNGNSFGGTLSESGEYRIQVYLYRNAARRGERANFTLNVSVTGRGNGGSGWPGGPGGPGDDGGPDFLQVSGLSRGDVLNVRTLSNPRAPIVARLRNGDVVRNGGCTQILGGRWCRVTTTTGRRITGWANGRYLIEGRATPY